MSTPFDSLRSLRAWIVLFGIVEIAIGLGCLLLCGLVLAVAAIGATPGLTWRTAGSSLALYLVFAAYFIGLGIGTVRKRRWARTLMLSTAWIWLAVGILAFGIVLVLLPRLGDLQGMPAGSEEGPVITVVKVFITLVVGFLYVVLPLVFVLFFRSPSVRRTFETEDPVPRWTDRCSGAVLSMILTLAYGAVTCLFALFWGVAPFFGIQLHGVPAAAVYLATGAVLAWLAHGFYELKWSAWWGTLALTLLWTVSSIVTFLRVPLEEMYRGAGFEAEAETIADMGLGAPLLVGTSLLTALSVVAYLIYLRKDFRAQHGFTSS